VGWRYLDIADFLIIAGAVLGVDPMELGRSDHLVALAESALGSPSASYEGHEFYPDVSRKAAVLFTHLARNHPLPDGNKRTALQFMVEFEELLANVTSNAGSGVAFVDWIAARLVKVTPKSVTP